MKVILFPLCACSPAAISAIEQQTGRCAVIRRGQRWGYLIERAAA